MKPELPESVGIEMTPKMYEAIKQANLQKVSPAIRTYLGTYFDWIRGIKPEDVVDAIQNGVTIEQAYKKLGFSPLRLGIAAARGFLKVSKNYQQQLKQAVNYEVVITTLQFENPTTYAVIQQYGEKGTEYLKSWIAGSLKILGVE